MNEYLSLVGLFIFAGIIGGIGLVASHVQHLKNREAEEARRKYLEH